MPLAAALILDADGRMAEPSAELVALVGPVPPGTSLFDLVREVDHASAMLSWSSALAGVRGRLSVMTKSGAPLSGELVPIVHDGAVTGAVFEIRAPSSDRRDRAVLELLLSRSPDFVFAQDLDLRYSFVLNPPAPWDPNAMLGRRDSDLLERAEAEPLEEAKRDVLGAGAADQLEVSFSPGGRPRRYRITLSAEREVDGTVVGLLGYARDITRADRAERDRDRAFARLARRERLEHLAELASSVAKELDDSLYSVSSHASLLQLGLQQAQSATTLDELIGECARASKLAREIVEYAGGSSPHRPEGRLSDCVQAVEHLLRAAWSELELDLERDGARVPMDAAQIEQLVVSLALMLREHRARADRLRIATRSGGGHTAIELSGVQLDEVVQARLRAREAPWNRVARAHEAQIEADQRSVLIAFSVPEPELEPLPQRSARPAPAPRTVSEAIVDRPTPPPARAATEPPSTDAQLRGDGIVLVIDPDPEARAASGKALVHYGYRVLFAETDTKAAEVLEKHARMIRGAVLAATMAALGLRLRQIKARLPIVVIGEGADLDGPTRQLSRPYEARDLAERIKAAIEDAGSFARSTVEASS